MALNLLALPQKMLPPAATGVLLTAPGSAWGNSGYVELEDSMPDDAVLSGIVVRPTFGFSFHAFDVEIDIATGASSSEAVIATFRWGAFNPPGQANPGNVIYPLPIGIDNIASGARVSARIRISTTDAFTCRVSATYYEKPLTGATYLTTANPQLAIPAASNSIVLTAGSSWGNGSYQELRTNSGAALVLVSLIAYGGSGGNVYHEVDIATGSDGAETVITTVAIHNDTTGTTPAWILFTLPLDNVAANTRVAARSRASVNSATIRVALNVIEKPL